MLVRLMTAVVACLFLLSISQTAFSQSGDSSKESKSKSSSTDEEKDDSKKDSDDEEAKKRKASDEEAAKKTILHRVGERGDEGGSLADILSEGGDKESFESAKESGSRRESGEQNDDPFSISLEKFDFDAAGSVQEKWLASPVQYCMDSVFKDRELVAGSFAVELELDARGWPRDSDVLDSDFGDDFDACVAKAYKRMRFTPREDKAQTAKIRWTVSLEDKE